MTMTTRRDFFGMAAAIAVLPSADRKWADTTSPYDLVATADRARILAAANRYLSEQPVTVTASTSPRSQGGPHDYFSEGDYWWPDEKNPDGPYIRRDGFSNPANFDDHRKAMVRLSLIVPALAAAWELTTREKICQSRQRTSQCMVRRSQDEDEPQPRIRAGHLPSEQGPRHRHHRHASSGRTRTRSNGSRKWRCPQRRT